MEKILMGISLTPVLYIHKMVYVSNQGQIKHPVTVAMTVRPLNVSQAYTPSQML